LDCRNQAKAIDGVYTNIMLTWDPQKAMMNFRKHGVSFEEAATVFADPNALDWEDIKHSGTETRLKRLGKSHSQRVLIIVYTIRST
jgi:uncharacterized DUF497 family protein